MPVRLLTFGNFTFDLSRGVLARAGAPVSLGTRKTRLLAALLSRAGQVVSKDELVAAGWPGTFVEESNLTVQVSQLRRLLEQADSPFSIMTLAGIGYRLEASVVEGSAAVSPWRPRLAIEPVSVVGESQFAAALSVLHVDIGAALSRVGWIDLVDGGAGPTDYRLGSTLRTIGQRTRLVCRLVRESSGTAWAGTIEEQGDDPFELSARLADRASSAIAWAIERHENTRDAETGANPARHLFAAARAKLLTSREPDNAAAYGLLLQALDLEPSNVRILAGLTEALQHRIGMGWSPITSDDWQACTDFATRGLGSETPDPGSVAAFGMALVNVREHGFAYATIRRAVAMNGASVDVLSCAGICSLHCGADIDDAMALFYRAQRLDPSNPGQRFVLTGLAHAHLIRGEYDQARAFALQSLSMNPFYSATHWMLVAADALQGNREAAARSLGRFRSLAPDITIECLNRAQPSKLRDRIEPFLEGLALAGLPEREGA